MTNHTHEKCLAIRNRLYPEDEWPGVIHEKALIDAGGGADDPVGGRGMIE